ncbi:MAG: hypothetical protein ACXACC_10040 [Promethearchaeota archaeon]
MPLALSNSISAMIEVVAPVISPSSPFAMIKMPLVPEPITGVTNAMIPIKKDTAISALVSFDFFLITIFTSNISFYSTLFF